MLDVKTYEGAHFVYACGSWGTREEADKAIEIGRDECDGYVNNSYCETREVVTEIKLTEKQEEIMMLIGPAPADRMSRYVWRNNGRVVIHNGRRTITLQGSHEHRTARSLEDKGLVRVFSSQKLGGSGYGVSLLF